MARQGFTWVDMDKGMWVTAFVANEPKGGNLIAQSIAWLGR